MIRLNRNRNTSMFFIHVGTIVSRNVVNCYAINNVLIAVDVTKARSKNFAAFPSHQNELQYSGIIHPQQRMLYEWISPVTPTKLCFDIDSSDPSIIGSEFLQETLISTVVNRTVYLLQDMDTDCSSIQ